MPESEKKIVRRTWIVFVIWLIISIVGAGIGIWGTIEMAEQNFKTDIQFDSSRILVQMGRNWEEINRLNSRTASLFEEFGKYLEPQLFSRLVDISTTNINVVTIGWRAYIKQHELPIMNKYLNDYIQPNKTVKVVITLDPNIPLRGPAPAPIKPEYLVLLYSLPPPDLFVLGTDIYQNQSQFYPDVDKMLNQTGQTTLSRSTVFNSVPDPKNRGLFIWTPVYQTNNTCGITSSAYRFCNSSLFDYSKTNNSLLGVVQVAVQPGELVRDALFRINLNSSQYQYAIYDVTNEPKSFISVSQENTLDLDVLENYDTFLETYSNKSKYINMLPLKRRNRKYQIILIPSDQKIVDNINQNSIWLGWGLFWSFINLLVFSAFISFLYRIKQYSVDQIAYRNSIAQQMIGYMGHEIRNPLNVVMGTLNLAIEQIQEEILPDLEDKQHVNEGLSLLLSDLNTASRQCTVIAHICNDVMDIHKLEQRKLSLNYKRLELEKLIKDIGETIKPKLNEKPNLQFHKTMDLDGVTIIETDPTRLTQILLNYLINSLKYTIDGHIELKVETITVNHKLHIKFSIIDTGVGIVPELQVHIFERFPHKLAMEDAITHEKNGLNTMVHVDTSRTGSNGLGLYLCKMLAEQMYGEVGFISQHQKGSTFWVILPIHKPIGKHIDVYTPTVVDDLPV